MSYNIWDIELPTSYFQLLFKKIITFWKNSVEKTISPAITKSDKRRRYPLKNVAEAEMLGRAVAVGDCSISAEHETRPAAGAGRGRFWRGQWRRLSPIHTLSTHSTPLSPLTRAWTSLQWSHGAWSPLAKDPRWSWVASVAAKFCHVAQE